MATTKLTAERVLAWRMRRHLLDRPAGVDAEPRDGEPVVTLWPESPPVPIERLDAERARLRSYLKKTGDA